MDLLDQLNAMDAADVVHALMPNMATACGIPALDLYGIQEANGGKRAHVLGSRGWLAPDRRVQIDADCPECIAAAEPHGGLRAWCTAMQRNQATGKG